MATAQPHVKLASFKSSCKAEACGKAVLISTAAHAAAAALLQAYEVMRQQRGRPRGMTTDAEQDLLRSMLVMAAAGLDATVKQLVEDALPQLIPINAVAQNTFEKFVLRRITAESSAKPGIEGLKLIAAALSSPDPQRLLVREYVNELTAGSLQSVQSLYPVAAALGVLPNEIGLSDALQPIFKTRNMIIHELDINLSARSRTRNVRSQTTMIRDTNRIFQLMQTMILYVDKTLTEKSQKK